MESVEYDIDVRGLSKSFVSANGAPLVVLNSLSFRVRAGDFVAVFGPNGCGKSTLLAILGGIDSSFDGDVNILGHAPVTTEIGHVFQDFNASLFPWMTVVDNVAFGLRMLGMPRRQRRERSLKWLKKMDLGAFADAYPYQMSGGMKQKICIARALMPGYRVLLLDEPFSALDHDTTYRLQQDFMNLWQKEPRTTVFVSHDIDEAVLLSDRILVLSDRPATIVKEVENPLPRPRTIDMLVQPNFISVRNEVIELTHQAAKQEKA